MSSTEEELVDRARRGDTAAYAELVRAHQEALIRIAWLITGNQADAEEAAQDAFVKAHAALGRFRSGRPLRPWLIAIASNEARNRRAGAARRERLAQRAAREPASLGRSPQEETLSAESREELVRALGRLSEPDRNVIACRYLLDLSERESAQVLRCRAGTVKSRLSRALERLRVELETGEARA